MTSVVEFLERMGKDAQLRHAPQEDLARALEESQVDAALGAAIIGRSTDDLYALLDLRPMFKTTENPGPWPWPLPPGAGDGMGENEKRKASPAEQAVA